MKAKLTLKMTKYLDAIKEAEQDIDAVARDATFEAAIKIQEEMQGLVPILTGRLWAHILIDGPHKDGDFVYCEVGIIHRIDFTPKDVAIQANVIEYGSSRQTAQPFFRPAMVRSRKFIRAALKQTLAKYGVVS